MFNLDTGTAIAFVAEGSPVRFLLRSYVREHPLLMTRTAITEFISIAFTIGGSLEQARANRLIRRVQTIPDSPSERASNLKPTRRLGEQDIIILGTGDRLGIITLTADAKAVNAALAQGVDFSVYLHPPCPLTDR
jgi:hypothetical protein